jgi:tetratricopeptide (TPR) repeat protein
MGYWVYYLAVLIAYYAADRPEILVALLAFFALRRWIPDPVVFLRTWSRMRALRAQIEANPANAIARRDLARLYLERLRPGAARKLIDEALERDPESAELLFLRGLALQRSGEPGAAIDPLVRAVAIDRRVGFGEAYLVAGDALSELKRHDEAIDAYERFLESNTSSVEGWTKLALAHHRAGEEREGKQALREARATWSQIPSYRRRRELGWYVRAQLLRMWI